jgi:hypothetical protein
MEVCIRKKSLLTISSLNSNYFLSCSVEKCSASLHASTRLLAECNWCGWSSYIRCKYSEIVRRHIQRCRCIRFVGHIILQWSVARAPSLSPIISYLVAMCMSYCIQQWIGYTTNVIAAMMVSVVKHSWMFIRNNIIYDSR